MHPQNISIIFSKSYTMIVKKLMTMSFCQLFWGIPIMVNTQVQQGVIQVFTSQQPSTPLQQETYYLFLLMKLTLQKYLGPTIQHDQNTTLLPVLLQVP
jgi:hypothetical protein